MFTSERGFSKVAVKQNKSYTIGSHCGYHKITNTLTRQVRWSRVAKWQDMPIIYS